MEKVVELKNISKSFGEVRAVRDANFSLIKGEVHSIIGENGAGKSTLLKILYGMEKVDTGEIYLGKQLVKNYSTKQAIDNNIGMVHQEFMLVKEFTVLENIILGFEPNNKGVIDFAKASKDLLAFVEKYNFEIDLNKKIKDLPVGEQQRVELVKTLYNGANIIILDEPTAVLTPQECVGMFEVVENLSKMGKSIIFVSHKLDEVMEISDRVTVMRHGETVKTLNKDELSKQVLANLIVGREIFINRKEIQDLAKDVIFEVKNLFVSGERELSKVKNVSLNVRAGEVLGIAGVDGNGQRELVEALCGLRTIEHGVVELLGKDITNKSPLEIKKEGVSHIPEDRNTRGLDRSNTIENNIVANRINTSRFSKLGILNKKAVSKYANEQIERFDVRPTDGKIVTINLSGGNAQKVVVAREMSTESQVIIASQPTRGVDIGSIEYIHNFIREAKENEKGILLLSADLEEILSLSDRIAVLYDGRIVGEVSSKEATSEKLGLLMTGGESE